MVAFLAGPTMIAASSTSEIACIPCVSEPGYDYRLRETVIQGLRRSGYSPLSNIKCEVFDGVVVGPNDHLEDRPGQSNKKQLTGAHSYFDPSL